MSAEANICILSIRIHHTQIGMVLQNIPAVSSNLGILWALILRFLFTTKTEIWKTRLKDPYPQEIHSPLSAQKQCWFP